MFREWYLRFNGGSFHHGNTDDDGDLETVVGECGYSSVHDITSAMSMAVTQSQEESLGPGTSIASVEVEDVISDLS